MTSYDLLRKHARAAQKEVHSMRRGRRVILTKLLYSSDVKVTLSQSYCTTLYCPFLWDDYKKSTFSKIPVAFNNAYRKIFGLPKRSNASTMYATHNMCNFEITEGRFTCFNWYYIHNE